MNFELRKLNATDIMPMATILGKIGIEEIADSFDQKTLNNIMNMSKEKGQNQEQTEWLAGVNVFSRIASVILRNIPKCDKEIYSFMAGVSGKTVKEIKELDLDVFLEMIVAIVSKDEFKSFFKVASKYIN